MKALIQKLLAIVRKALANDPDNTAEREKLRKEVASLTAEKTELEALTPEINQLIDDATAATPEDGGGGEPAADGVTFGFSSEGDEKFSVVVKNTGISSERKALLKSLYDGAVLSGQSQAAGGASFPTTAFIDSGSGKVETKFDNAKQKAAFDVAILTGFLSEAQAQLDS